MALVDLTENGVRSPTPYRGFGLFGHGLQSVFFKKTVLNFSAIPPLLPSTAACQHAGT